MKITVGNYSFTFASNYSAPPIENFSLIKHKLDFAYFLHHYKLFND